MTADRLTSIRSRIAALKRKQDADAAALRRRLSTERAARLHAKDPRYPSASSRIFIAPPSRAKGPDR